MIHNNYNKLAAEQMRAVDDAFHAAFESLRESGYNPPVDDDAERAVEALATYLLKCEEK